MGDSLELSPAAIYPPCYDPKQNSSATWTTWRKIYSTPTRSILTVSLSSHKTPKSWEWTSIDGMPPNHYVSRKPPANPSPLPSTRGRLRTACFVQDKPRETAIRARTKIGEQKWEWRKKRRTADTQYLERGKLCRRYTHKIYIPLVRPMDARIMLGGTRPPWSTHISFPKATRRKTSHISRNANRT